MIYFYITFSLFFFTQVIILGLSCRTLLPPKNGSLICTNGNKTNSTCSYFCDVGYQLIGSSQRTCQSNRTWSGVSPICRPLQCPQLNPPDNGYIQLPCSHDYLSVCAVRCFDGYNIITGSDTVKCRLINTTTVEWTPSGKCESELLLNTIIIKSSIH